jgi:cytochrome c oxidase subunit 1/cytochrome c oxidase subunit I+III
MWGRLMDERLGQLSFWLIFLGFNATFFPMHIAGLLGMPRRIYTYHSGLGWDPWNLISTIGGYVMAAGLLATVLNTLHTYALRRGAESGPDPWGGESLEWATSSPPPHYNFREIPTVRSAEPVWDQPELRAEAIRVQEMTLAEEHETLGTSVLDAEPEVLLPMPEESYTPVVTAFGLAMLATGILLGLSPVIVAGGLVAAGGLLAWFRWEGGGAVAE